MNRVRNLILILVAALAALLAVELFLQVTQSRTLAMGLYYSPGIHTPDERFGFAFTPHYSGVMQHPDRVFAVPLTLDEYGFRPPIANREEGPVSEVLFVGGMSMMFSYGLPNIDSLPGQVGLAAEHPIRVRNRAWPGFHFARNYEVAKTLLGDRFPGDVVVLAIFWVDGTKPEAVGSDLWDRPGVNDYFRYFDDLVVEPQGTTPLILGGLYYDSYLVYNFGRLADRWLPERWLKTLHDAPPPPAKKKIQRESFKKLLARAVDEIRAGGAEPLIVFLPTPVTLPHSYEKQYQHVPEGVRWIDLHDALARTEFEVTTVANHYSAEATHAAGRILAREIDALLDAR